MATSHKLMIHESRINLSNTHMNIDALHVRVYQSNRPSALRECGVHGPLLVDLTRALVGPTWAVQRRAGVCYWEQSGPGDLEEERNGRDVVQGKTNTCGFCRC